MGHAKPSGHETRIITFHRQLNQLITHHENTTVRPSYNNRLNWTLLCPVTITYQNILWIETTSRSFPMPYCCEVTRLRSRLISVEYVTGQGLLRQYQLRMYVSLYVCMHVCISPLLPRFQVIEIEAISYFVQKVTVSRARMLKASEGCTNSHD